MKNFWKRLTSQDALRDEEGSVAVETIIIIPMLFWMFLVLFSIYDTFRQYAVTQKVSYTIGDMISRETVPLDSTYLDGAHDLFDYMTEARGPTAIRVTLLQWDDDKKEFEAPWSKSRGWEPPLTDGDVKHYIDRIPKLRPNEYIMLVETWMKYEAPFKTGLEKREIENFIFTAPRYVPRICWETCETL